MKEIGKTDQYALVAFLISRASQANQKLSKKALQKKVHLIQELGDIDTGYQFSFHSYGPYSANLAGDLDVIEISDGATITYNDSSSRYEIGCGRFTNKMVEEGNEFISTHQSAIERVLDAFDDRSAQDLGLVSMIAYLRSHSPKEEFEDNEKIAKRVMLLRPKCEEAVVDKTIGEVKNFLTTQIEPCQPDSQGMQSE